MGQLGRAIILVWPPGAFQAVSRRLGDREAFEDQEGHDRAGTHYDQVAYPITMIGFPALRLFLCAAAPQPLGILAGGLGHLGLSRLPLTGFAGRPGNLVFLGQGSSRGAPGALASLRFSTMAG